MDKNTYEMVSKQIAIAREALAALPHADRTASDRLRNQLALALDSIAALVQRTTA